MNLIPQRGELWIASLDPTKGSEIKKTKPCQIRVAAKERLKKRIGEISSSHLEEMEEKLLFYLGFYS